MKTWVLLRGLGRDKRHFGPFLSAFKQAFANDRVITIDTLGNGDFRHLKSPIAIKQYTEHCRSELNKLLSQQSTNSSVELVALSLGGMIAIDWAQRYPQQINSITIMNTSAANLTPPYKRMQLKTLSRLLYAFIIKRQPQAIETAIIKATSNTSAANPIAIQQVIDEWTNIREQGVTTTLNMVKQLFAAARFNVKPHTKKQTSKVLILSSKNDNIVNHRASLDLQRFFTCTMQVHPQAGHDLPLDAPDWAIKQIQYHQT